MYSASTTMSAAGCAMQGTRPMLSARPAPRGAPIKAGLVRTTRGARLTARASPPASNKPVVLVAEKLGAGGLEMLEKVATVDESLGMSKEDLLAKVSLVDALVIRSATKVTREVFEASKGRLRVVGRAGVGIDNVDLPSASEHGCLVVNAPTANTVAAAEHAIALLTSLTRNVVAADRSIKEGRWDRSKYVGVSVIGKTLAIIGFGKVGSEVARRARGLGLTVIAYDPYASEERALALGVRLVSLDEALAAGDFFSLHMPLTPSTKGLFGEAAFAKIKRGALIVNVARGGIIDDDALARALDSGAVAGAALDVFAKEPVPADHPVAFRPDVIATPHLGASTREAQEEVSYEIAEAVLSALRGELTPSAVNAPSVPPEALRELAPYVGLAAALGRAVSQLAEGRSIKELRITYRSSRGEALDARLLRASVIRGLLQNVTESVVNIVNADLLAKKRGIKIVETVEPGSQDGAAAIESLEVSVPGASPRFSAALAKDGAVSVAGTVKGDVPFFTRIGSFDVDLASEGDVLLVRQTDQPGIIAAVASHLAKDDVNIAFMSVGRTARGREAVMAIGVDVEPSAAARESIRAIPGVQETAFFSENA